MFLTNLQLDTIEVKLQEELSNEELLNSIIRALDNDTKADTYVYIARMHDIDISDILEWD